MGVGKSGGPFRVGGHAHTLSHTRTMHPQRTKPGAVVVRGIFYLSDVNVDGHYY